MDILNTLLNPTVIKILIAVVAVEKALTLISELTPWKWDDNVARIVSNIVKNVLKPLLPKRTHEGNILSNRRTYQSRKAMDDIFATA